MEEVGEENGTIIQKLGGLGGLSVLYRNDFTTVPVQGRRKIKRIVASYMELFKLGDESLKYLLSTAAKEGLTFKQRI